MITLCSHVHIRTHTLTHYVRVHSLQNKKYRYGLHWNFFVTLGVVFALHRVISKCVISSGSAMTPLRLVLIAAVIGMLHQLALWVCVEEWVATAPRDGFLSANKEGIASLAGYTSIFFAGEAAGMALFSPTATSMAQLLIVPMSTSWLAWVASSSAGLQTSRKLTNISYVLWPQLHLQILPTFCTFCGHSSICKSYQPFVCFVVTTPFASLPTFRAFCDHRSI